MKRTASALTLILTLLVLLLAGVQTVKAPYTSDVDTTATIVAIPDPIGVGQIIKFIGDINPNPPTSPLGFRDISIIINYPDGSNVTLGPFISNAAGEVTTKFVPTIVGVYSVRFTFLGGTLSDGHYYQPCEAATNFTVQPESVWGPVGSFTFDPTAPEVDETVTFDASNSSDLGGNIVSYEWDFGDQTTGSGVNSTHAYSSEGIYIVTLIITDNDGIADIATKIITVMPKPLPPEASFTFSPASPEVNETVTFDASNSSDPDGTIVNYFWSFGDGTTENQTGGVTTIHSYTSEGSYNVTLTVTDNDQLTYTTTKSITVNPPPKEDPEASFTYSLLDPEANETVTFDASGSSDPDGTIINYFWDFGDGTTGAGIVATHSYTLDGTYTVTLTVADSDALTDTTTKTINNVIPEFPSWIILPLLLTATLLIILFNRKLPKTPCQKSY
jgi:PKD repeat protein